MQVTLVRHTRVDVPRGVCYGWSDVQIDSIVVTADSRCTPRP